MSKHTREELRQWQALPLSIKIRMTEQRIRDWVHEYGEEGVYVSFSGGKDSTVLLDIVRNRMGYKNIPAVFVDVPTQFPELREFAKTFDNLVILRPKINFMQVCEKYGFPIISKEISECVYYARKYLAERERERVSGEPQKIKNVWAIADALGIERRGKDAKSQELESIQKGIIPNIEEAPIRVQALYGKVIHKEKGVVTNEYSKQYDKSKYQFFLDAPFEISSMCCKAMKKAPIAAYSKQTGRLPMTGTMAAESTLRTSQWLRYGCNSFEGKHPISNPMAFWTDQDVLQYIKQNNIPICSVYGDVVEDCETTGQIEGQMSFVDDCEVPLKTTGCSRTGCACCGFGAHMPDDDRFLKLKESHPGMLKLLDLCKNNGVTFREAIEWTNEHLDDRHKIKL